MSKSKRLIAGAYSDMAGDQPGADNSAGSPALLEAARLVLDI